MNKKYVTSLKLSRELKELGVKQDSIFSWYKNEKGEVIKGRAYSEMELNLGGAKWIKICSTFLSGELGEKLPKDINNDWLCISKAIDSWVIEYQDLGLIEKAKTLAEAMGKMLAYLIKNKLIII